jgi:hypothetical protein
MAGTLLRFTGATRGLRISWLTVGIKTFLFLQNSVSKALTGRSGAIPIREFGHKPHFRGPARTISRGSETASCAPEMSFRS